MYFITANPSGDITGVYDGSSDYVHRVTGEALPGARPIPDNSIKITQAEYALIVKVGCTRCLQWNGRQVVEKVITPLEQKRAELLSRETKNYESNRSTEIDAMTEAELDAALGGV